MTSIKVPPLGESIVEATVSRWMKKEGDVVSPGDTLVELETDKITVEVPAMSRGVLTKRLHAEGDVVKVDDLLGEIDESAAPALAKRESAGATAAAGAAPAGRGATATTTPASTPPPPPTAKAVPSAPPPAPTPTSKAAEAPKGELRASPAAERLASQKNVDLNAVSGSGRGGVVSKADVVDFVGDGQPAAPRAPSREPPTAPIAPPAAVPPVPTGARETREKLSTRRKRIAEHLLESQHATAIPMLT